MCEMCITQFVKNDDLFFDTNSEIVEKLLSLLESNWQSPIKGINSFIKELYKSIIKLNEKESERFSVNNVHLVSYMLDKTMLLSWQVKGKYFLLSVILQMRDYDEVSIILSLSITNF